MGLNWVSKYNSLMGFFLELFRKVWAMDYKTTANKSHHFDLQWQATTIRGKLGGNCTINLR